MILDNPKMLVSSREMDYREMIAVDFGQHEGKAFVRGTGATVLDVLDYLSQGHTQQETLAHFPKLTWDGIRACLAFAAEQEATLAITRSLGSSPPNPKLTTATLNSESEASKRLRMLHEIGSQLSIDQGLSNIFERVVRLTSEQLHAEEAALFVPDKQHGNILKKVAAVGPTDESTARVESIEREYRLGEGLIGTTFRTMKSLQINLIPPNVGHYDEYLLALPSKRVSHYIAVPLVIGDDVLGVIRVINKKAPDYSTDSHNYSLAHRGFDSEDLELMQTIASQVAAAIRSAEFVEVQRYHENIVANSPDPIIVLDRIGRVVLFNAACERVWGYSANEVLGRQVDDFYESLEHAKHIASVLRASANSKVEDFQARIKSRTGEIIPISLSAALLLDRNGKVSGSIGVFKDLRETLHLQEEQLRAGKLATLGRLAHTVGHDVKHHIATALNYIDTLRYECSDAELLAIYTEIQESLNEALVKFRNMLMVGKPQPPLTKLVAVDRAFQETEMSIRRMAHSRQVSYTVSYDASEQTIEADTEQLRQVLFNLFDNSIDAIQVKRGKGAVSGRIEMSTAVRSSAVQIIWSDDGCGVSSDRLADLCLPFVSNKANGNGLGLFIVKSIVENHGGTISIQSDEDVNTTVKILLPLRTSDAVTES